MTAEAKWLPVAQQILDKWGVKHESLKGTIAAEIAGIVAEERERCAKIAENYSNAKIQASDWKFDIATSIRAAPK